MPDRPNSTLAIPGQYISGSTSIVPGSILAPEGVVHYVPFIPGRNLVLDRLAVNVEVAGSAGSVVRLGIYRDDGEDQPDTVLIDAGTVPTVSTGLKFTPISRALTGGDRYWFAAVQQGGASITATYTSFTGATGTVTAVNPGGTFSGALKLGVSGALPSPASVPVTLLGSQVMIRVLGRVAP